MSQYYVNLDSVSVSDTIQGLYNGLNEFIDSALRPLSDVDAVDQILVFWRLDKHCNMCARTNTNIDADTRRGLNFSLLPFRVVGVISDGRGTRTSEYIKT